MNAEPPEGSQIKLERDMYSTTYTWENGQKSIGQYGVAAFMIFWLCGWTVGGVMAAMAFVKDDDMPLFARLFLLFWLGGWACGEAAVIYSLYHIFKGFQPAKLILSSRCFEYVTGTKPFNFNNYRRSEDLEKRPKFFQSFRNKTYRIESNDPFNLQLERVGERQRLTFDIGAERIEIGDVLSEPEREWLYEVLKEHISR
jgi:hypothetical protein